MAGIDPSIGLRSGALVDLTDPHPDAIGLEDIARGLSLTCRFGGHIDRFYSVAEHAVMVSAMVAAKGGSPVEVLAALHHDDAEALVGDIPRPMKPLLGEPWARLEAGWAAAMEVKWNLPPDAFDSDIIHEADLEAALFEASMLMPRGTWWRSSVRPLPDGVEWRGGLPPREAEHLYLVSCR